MSEHVQAIETEAEFRDTVRSGVVLVDFFATWCGPCKMQGPILDQVADKIAGAAKIVKVDTDKLSQLAAEFDVSSIPTLIVFKDGQAVNRLVGLQQADKLEAVLRDA